MEPVVAHHHRRRAAIGEALGNTLKDREYVNINNFEDFNTTLVTLFCIFPAITEEIAFRGLVQHWLVSAIAPMRALVIASALFMALHFSVLSAPYLFLVGMLLGWAKLKTGSLYPSMLIHFLHNFIVISFFHL